MKIPEAEQKRLEEITAAVRENPTATSDNGDVALLLGLLRQAGIRSQAPNPHAVIVDEEGARFAQRDRAFAIGTFQQAAQALEGHGASDMGTNQLRPLLEEAYNAAWGNTGEGWNGEINGPADMLKDAVEKEMYEQQRAKAIEAILLAAKS